MECRRPKQAIILLGDHDADTLSLYIYIDGFKPACGSFNMLGGLLHMNFFIVLLYKQRVYSYILQRSRDYILTRGPQLQQDIKLD